MKERWIQLEEYLISKLKTIDPNARRTPGSGNKGSKGDVKFSTNIGLHIEAKYRSTDSVTIKKDVWQKLNEEIPLHVKKIPLLALENKEGKRWAVVDLDDFLDLYIENWYLKGPGPE